MVTMNQFRVFLLAFLLVASPFVRVARAQPSAEDEAASETVDESSDLGIVGEDVQDFGDEIFNPAPGIDTVSVFPKNSARVVTAGEETDLLVGVKNDGDSSVTVIAIKASVHLPFDHKMLVQNLTTMVSLGFLV
uniref:Translocon-associated protein subunit alpha n=1 Tax=Cannabis sativa TaxID=3483 RepID=A0A803QSZ7_CANSA